MQNSPDLLYPPQEKQSLILNYKTADPLIKNFINKSDINFQLNKEENFYEVQLSLKHFCPSLNQVSEKHRKTKSQIAIQTDDCDLPPLISYRVNQNLCSSYQQETPEYNNNSLQQNEINESHNLSYRVENQTHQQKMQQNNQSTQEVKVLPNLSSIPLINYKNNDNIQSSRSKSSRKNMCNQTLNSHNQENENDFTQQLKNQQQNYIKQIPSNNYNQNSLELLQAIPFINEYSNNDVQRINHNHINENKDFQKIVQQYQKDDQNEQDQKSQNQNVEYQFKNYQYFQQQSKQEEQKEIQKDKDQNNLLQNDQSQNQVYMSQICDQNLCQQQNSQIQQELDQEYSNQIQSEKQKMQYQQLDSIEKILQFISIPYDDINNNALHKQQLQTESKNSTHQSINKSNDLNLSNVDEYDQLNIEYPHKIRQVTDNQNKHNQGLQNSDNFKIQQIQNKNIVKQQNIEQIPEIKFQQNNTDLQQSQNIDKMEHQNLYQNNNQSQEKRIKQADQFQRKIQQSLDKAIEDQKDIINIQQSHMDLINQIKPITPLDRKKIMSYLSLIDRQSPDESFKDQNHPDNYKSQNHFKQISQEKSNDDICDNNNNQQQLYENGSQINQLQKISNSQFQEEQVNNLQQMEQKNQNLQIQQQNKKCIKLQQKLDDQGEQKNKSPQQLSFIEQGIQNHQMNKLYTNQSYYKTCKPFNSPQKSSSILHKSVISDGKNNSSSIYNNGNEEKVLQQGMKLNNNQINGIYKPYHPNKSNSSLKGSDLISKKPTFLSSISNNNILIQKPTMKMNKSFGDNCNSVLKKQNKIYQSQEIGNGTRNQIISDLKLEINSSSITDKDIHLLKNFEQFNLEDISRGRQFEISNILKNNYKQIQKEQHQPISQSLTSRYSYSVDKKLSTSRNYYSKQNNKVINGDEEEQKRMQKIFWSHIHNLHTKDLLKYYQFVKNMCHKDYVKKILKEECI